MKRGVILLLLLCCCLRPLPAEQKASYDEIMSKLETSELSKISFSEEPLSSVLDYLREACGVNFVAREEVLTENPTVTLTLKEITVKNFIKVVASYTNTKFIYDDGVIMVAKKDQIVQKPVLRIYSIGTLNVQVPDFPGPEIILTTDDSGMATTDAKETEVEPLSPEEIVDIIKKFCGGDTWDNVEGVSISARGSQLIVMQTPEVHEQISHLLVMLGQ